MCTNVRHAVAGNSSSESRAFTPLCNSRQTLSTESLLHEQYDNIKFCDVLRDLANSLMMLFLKWLISLEIQVFTITIANNHFSIPSAAISASGLVYSDNHT